MNPSVMKLLGTVFFISLPLWILLTISTVLGGAGVGEVKATAVLGLVALGSFLAMLGGLVLVRFERLTERRAAPPPPGP